MYVYMDRDKFMEIYVCMYAWKHGCMLVFYVMCVLYVCVCVCVCVCVFARKHVYKFCVNLSNENSYMCGYVGIIS